MNTVMNTAMNDVAHALVRAVSRLRTPDLVESAVSLSWGRSPTCPAAIQNFPTGQVGDLPHEGSAEIPASPTRGIGLHYYEGMVKIPLAIALCSLQLPAQW